MVDRMKVVMLLADSAQAIGNKLYILGGGWSITGPAPTPMAFAIKIEVPWNDTNKKHQLRLVLVDQDERPVRVPTPVGEQPVEIQSEFEVGRPVGITVGTPIDYSLAINLGPLPIPPGGRYVWKCFINNELQEEVSFSTRPLPQSQQPQPQQG
jgi:hypothetical protein